MQAKRPAFTLQGVELSTHAVDPRMYERYTIKRGLRNADGSGVVVGVTSVSNVHGYVISDEEKTADEGVLTYRGYNIVDLVSNAVDEKRFGFEEAAYLLMSGDLPTQTELEKFNKLLQEQRDLPDGFTINYIAQPPTRDIMNAMGRSILSLYAFDERAEERSAEHEVDTAIMLMSRLPRIMVLAYHVLRNKFHGDSLFIHPYREGEATAETILSMLRPDREYTELEARVLDVMMMIHAEHGGGNNSTFSCRSLTSADTDPYSAYAAAIGSLKGARHGGANARVLAMADDAMEHIKDAVDEGSVADYLNKVLDGKAFDHTGLIYGMGHAVYTLSDPRAILLKKYARKLVDGTEFEKEFQLLEHIEALTPELMKSRGRTKDVCANVDMYSGLVYRAMGIPQELFTPLFASARIAGWSAHRFEEIVSGKRIMRPAYRRSVNARTYTSIAQR